MLPNPQQNANTPTQRILRCIALLLLVAVLCACASAGGGGYLHADLRPAEGEPQGWLVASIGVFGEAGKLPPFEGNDVDFRPVPALGRASTGSFYVRIVDVANAPREGLDVVDGNKLQKVVVIPLREGRYEITGGSMSTNVGVASSSYRSQPGFSQPFDIRAGEITYVGSYLARVLMGENRLGMTIRAGAYYEISDRQQRDLALARSREPTLPANAKVTDAIPRLRELTAGMFLFVE